jgi:hypothetical protein
MNNGPPILIKNEKNNSTTNTNALGAPALKIA